MTDPRPTFSQFTASDGYSLHITRWAALDEPRGRCVVLHGVQSHAGWYENLGSVLSRRGYETIFPDRRGSGKNPVARGHVSSYRRLIADIKELLSDREKLSSHLPTALAGISWGGKLAVITTAEHPELVDALALICPGLHPRVDVERRERLRIAWAYFTNRDKHFPIPLADPALFTASPAGQAFIANDTLSLRTATASLLAASRFIDRKVRSYQRRLRQPTLLMLADHDRIVNNGKTRAYFEGIPALDRTIIDYPDGHHTLEFEADPSQYATDLANWFDSRLCSKVTEMS